MSTAHGRCPDTSPPPKPPGPAASGFFWPKSAMTVYYNEIDKYAAQWLRNLTLNQDRKEGSSFGPTGGDRSGTAPRPSVATSCSPQSFVVQVSRAQACARSQSLAFHRIPRSIVAHQDSVRRSADSGCPAPTFLWFWRDRSPPSGGDAHEMSARIWHYLLSGTRQNKAICCFALGQCGTTFRIAGNGGRLRRTLLHWSGDMRPCSALNSTCDASAKEAMPQGIEYMPEEVAQVPFLEVT